MSTINDAYDKYGFNIIICFIHSNNNYSKSNKYINSSELKSFPSSSPE